MCFFRRIVYSQCAHAYPSDPSPARKCDLQLAYESGEAPLPCGRIGAHSYASLRVGGRCRRCARADGALGRIREELRRARLKLRIPEAGVGQEKEKKKSAAGGSVGKEDGDGEGMGMGKDDDGAGDEDEGMSPVALTFSSVVLGVPVELRGSSVSRMGSTAVGNGYSSAEAHF